jgi:hypothetical protein
MPVPDVEATVSDVLDVDGITVPANGDITC